MTLDLVTEERLTSWTLLKVTALTAVYSVERRMLSLKLEKTVSLITNI